MAKLPACQNYILDLQQENLAWYRRGFADALAGVPPMDDQNLAN
jgi:hypothetical protein